MYKSNRGDCDFSEVIFLPSKTKQVVQCTPHLLRGDRGNLFWERSKCPILLSWQNGQGHGEPADGVTCQWHQHTRSYCANARTEHILYCLYRKKILFHTNSAYSVSNTVRVRTHNSTVYLHTEDKNTYLCVIVFHNALAFVPHSKFSAIIQTVLEQPCQLSAFSD